MNPNDLIAQYQALLQNAQNWQFIYLAVWLGSVLVGVWVLYMFYARLRDIADTPPIRAEITSALPFPSQAA